MFQDENCNFNQQQSQPTTFPAQFPGYPTYPAYQNPWAWHPVFQMGAEAIQAERGRALAEIENAQLRMRLGCKELAEDAYTTTGSASGRTFTVDKTGRFVELMNREIQFSRHIFPQAPFTAPDFYEVKLDGVEREIILTSAQYARDSELLQAFQEVPGLQIRFCRTAKLTAALLRQAICQRISMVELPFYAGWRKEVGTGFSFWVFPSGAAHIQPDGNIQSVTANTAMTASAMATAVQLFNAAFPLDCTQPNQWFLSCIFHIAALTSLLQEMDYPFPLSVCLLTESAAGQAWAKALFSWFDDPALSLYMPPEKFANGLLYYKDEPLVILDDRGGNLSAKNAALLEDVLASRQIPWKNGRQQRYMALLALPVILSTTASALTTSPDCLTLEFPAQLDGPVPENSEAAKADYLRAFTQYAAEHIDRLRWMLDTMEDRAFYCVEDCAWPEHYVRAVGTILAIDCFVREFHAFCDLDVRHLCLACPDAEAWLAELVEQTADKLLDYGDLAAQFIAVARSMLDNGGLFPCPVKCEEEPACNAVYYDERSLGFTTSAMTAICQQLGQSRPVVLRALAQADLFQGKPVNSGTLLTRISIWNVYGIRKTQRVYKLPRAAFDTLGEPLTFEREAIR